MPWNDRSLFEKIVEGISAPVDLTEEVLLWCGFLVMRHRDKLYLSVGSHEDDIRLLRTFLPVEEWAPEECPHENGEHDCAPCEPPVLTDTSIDVFHAHAPYRIEETADKDLLFSILSAPRSGSGLTGGNDHYRGPGENWNFGRRVPVRYLETGITLLVKVMPLLRLETVLSCEGHDHDEPPYITFASRPDAYWARVALPQFLPPNDPFVDDWLFFPTNIQYCCGMTLAPHGCSGDPERMFALFKNVQRLCRNIINSYWEDSGTHRRYNPDGSLAALARLTFGNNYYYDEWCHGIDDPNQYIFSPDHAGGFRLPKMTVDGGEKIRKERTFTSFIQNRVRYFVEDFRRRDLYKRRLRARLRDRSHSPPA